MSYRDWHVGMKVVCIADSYRPWSAPAAGEVPNLPRKGQVYTIRSFHKSGNLWLVEIRNKRRVWRTGRHEYAFHPSRFRPVQPRKTDISLFHEILRKTTKKVGEPA